MTDEILFDKESGLAWVTFNRPQARNALTWEMHSRLKEICDTVDNDPHIKVVIFRGAGGKAFVAGTDITQFAEFADADAGVRYQNRMDQLIDRIESISKPTIALLEGFCVGGGATIAMACDFRYATPDLKFGVPIARTLGNCLSMGNMGRLIDLLGAAKTKELLMLGALADASTALAVGLVNALHPAEDIEAQVRQIAARLMANAPLTVRAVKEAVQRIQRHRRLPAEAGEDLIRSCYNSNDFREAVQSFIDKTPHTWSGT